jgi:CTP synthase (UTP-ammonia lyase)
MTAKATIAVVGDWNPGNDTHLATNAALDHAGAAYEWVPTGACDGDAASRLECHGGVFVAPASPYRSMRGALAAIRHARERGVPLVGT